MTQSSKDLQVHLADLSRFGLPLQATEDFELAEEPLGL